MNKIILSIGIVAFSIAPSAAQVVLGYSVARTEGNEYIPLTEATSVFDGSDIDAVDTEGFDSMVFTAEGVKTGWDIVEANGYQIGFDVEIAGKTYSNFAISSAGYIYLGSETISVNPAAKSHIMTYSGEYEVFGFASYGGTRFSTDTKITYGTVGSGETERLVVEFSDIDFQNDTWEEDAPVKTSFQVSVYKDGRMSLAFKDFTSTEEQTVSGYDFLRLGSPADLVCGAEVDGKFVTLRGRREIIVYSESSPAGITYMFNLPEPCVKPSAQPSDLSLEMTSNQIRGSFAASASADNYLVLYAEVDKPFSVPENQTIYAPGDKLGDAIVAYYGDETSFSISGLPGGTSYNCLIFAANAYGLDGPVYNTDLPLSGTVKTLPAPVESVDIIGVTADEVTLSVMSNKDHDSIVVFYNNYCNRDGNHGYISELPEYPHSEQELPVPDDFTPPYDFEGAPMPANGGTVAYYGNPDNEIKISGLKAGTQYYITVYTRDDEGRYTSEPFYTGAGTIIEYPYEQDSYNTILYQLPFGWNSSEGSISSFEYNTKSCFGGDSAEPLRGTQYVQEYTRISQGNAIDGVEGWLTPVSVHVNERHLLATFNYSIIYNERRSSKLPYNEWAENDILQIRISEDDGETWTVLSEYNYRNHPVQENITSYVPIEADLNAYRGKTVLVQLYWKTYMTPAFGGEMYVDGFALPQDEFPAVPELTVTGISDSSAFVSWKSQQTDYELVYTEKDSDIFTTVNVKSANNYTLTNLLPETEYEVKVRGIIYPESAGSDLSEEDGDIRYSEWSDILTFTTSGYPSIDAPSGLKADTRTFSALGYVLLQWDRIQEAESYEVAYRLPSETEWKKDQTQNTELILFDLEAGEEYIWKVRAFCTHDRVTPYSAQMRFTVPDKSGIDELKSKGVIVRSGIGYIEVRGAEGKSVSLYTASGVKIVENRTASVMERFDLASGVYIVVVDNIKGKYIVR